MFLFRCSVPLVQTHVCSLRECDDIWNYTTGFVWGTLNVHMINRWMLSATHFHISCIQIHKNWLNMFLVTKRLLWKMTVRIHVRIKKQYSIPQMSWTEVTIQYGHFIIFIGLINTVTKNFSEVLHHNIFLNIKAHFLSTSIQFVSSRLYSLVRNYA